MENNKKVLGNISISGSGSAGGGEYDSIKISGSGKITGDTVCNEFKCSGSGKVVNSLKVGTGKVSGSAKFEDSLTAEQFSVSGSATIVGPFTVGELKTSGSLKVESEVKGESIHVSGSIKIEGDCSAEQFYLSGGCQIGGLLNADQIDIKLGGRCDIQTIGAEAITVKVGHLNGALLDLFSSLFSQEPYLYASAIEGDDIYLENTVAKMVRGRNIVLGRGCDIETVEYSGSLDLGSGAKVKEQTQI